MAEAFDLLDLKLYFKLSAEEVMEEADLALEALMIEAAHSAFGSPHGSPERAARGMRGSGSCSSGGGGGGGGVEEGEREGEGEASVMAANVATIAEVEVHRGRGGGVEGRGRREGDDVGKRAERGDCMFATFTVKIGDLRTEKVTLRLGVRAIGEDGGGGGGCDACMHVLHVRRVAGPTLQLGLVHAAIEDALIGVMFIPEARAALVGRGGNVTM